MSQSKSARAERDARQAAIRSRGKVSTKQHKLIWIGSIAVVVICSALAWWIATSRGSGNGGGSDGPAVNQGTTGNNQPERRPTASEEAEALFASVDRSLRNADRFLKDAREREGSERDFALQKAAQSVFAARTNWATGIAKHVEAGGDDPRGTGSDIDEADKKISAKLAELKEAVDADWDAFVADPEVAGWRERCDEALAGLPAQGDDGEDGQDGAGDDGDE